ncbi:MAG: type II secretion system protein [Planctomycetota bacterium]
MSGHRKGFTIIEMVMVVAILGVFSVLLVPNFVDYLRKSQASTTKASLQMLRTAIQAYRSDNSSHPPKHLNSLIPLFLPEIPKDGVKSQGDEIDPPVNGAGGWIYNPVSGRVRPNLFGNDAYGLPFSDY